MNGLELKLSDGRHSKIIEAALFNGRSSVRRDIFVIRMEVVSEIILGIFGWDGWRGLRIKVEALGSVRRSAGDGDGRRMP